MEKSKMNIRIGILSLIVLLAAFSRLIPHPPNFTPIGAMSLFAAAYFSPKYLAFIVPIAAMWLSDLLLNNVIYGQYFNHFVWFYKGFYWTYIGFIGFGMLKIVRPLNILIGSLSASVIFFSGIQFRSVGSRNNVFSYFFRVNKLLCCRIAIFQKYNNGRFSLFWGIIRSIRTYSVQSSGFKKVGLLH